MFNTDTYPLRINYQITHAELASRIDRMSTEYCIEFVPLEKTKSQDIPHLKVARNRIGFVHNGTEFFFHPSMSLLRMINISRGIIDRFLQATQIGCGDTFLDATMGLASDTLMAAWAVGLQGQAIGIEKSPYVYVVVQEGLLSLRNKSHHQIHHQDKQQAWLKLSQAAKRVITVWEDHYTFLKNQPSASIDIIYFDPMFRAPIHESSSMSPLRNWSNQEPLCLESIQEACRVARKRVVLKERSNSSEFQRLGFRTLEEKSYSSIRFGTIEVGGSRS